MSGTVGVELPATDPLDGEPVPGVALVAIDRPAALNALDRATMSDLLTALGDLDRDPDCRCVVLTGGGERAFAAGADIREMLERTTTDMLSDDFLAPWDQVAGIATPLVAAVRGFCLGGGFELALACDIIVAADDAVFGLPEITLGIIPGAGGTQRLTRIVGKSRAMGLILTGARITAADAERWGIVSAVTPTASLLSDALRMAASIASMPPIAVRAAAAAVDMAFETSLRDGIAAERRHFADLFDTDDQEEGMRAFLEHRSPRWTGH
jgi:enoyl-CoA hydratase